VNSSAPGAGATESTPRQIFRRIIRPPAAPRLPAVLVAVAGALALFYGLYLGPHRAAATRNSQRASICDIADVVVDTGKYPPLAEFLPTEWRYIRGSAARTGDGALTRLTRVLPVAPHPPAMRPVAAYCHKRGLGVILRSS
jgi:hypothetical protein